MLGADRAHRGVAERIGVVGAVAAAVALGGTGRAFRDAEPDRDGAERDLEPATQPGGDHGAQPDGDRGAEAPGSTTRSAVTGLCARRSLDR